MVFQIVWYMLYMTKTYHFKIQIKGIQKPPVWRRVVVPSIITFDIFHQIIQAAFGWGDYHLYNFSLRAWTTEPVYQIPDDEEFDYNDVETKDSRIAKISEVFIEPKQTFTYMYDFGDNWEHHIVLEKITDEAIINALCTDGKSACPPEDCGGVPGYYHLIDILNEPKHPDHKQMKSWLGMTKDDYWNVNSFDAVIANRRCAEIPLS